MWLLSLKLILLFLSAAVSADFADKIAQDGASGPKVVEQVVSLIGRTCIGTNELFLRRMAHVETKDGTESGTYKTGYNGGIWKIDEIMFNDTKNQSKLAHAYDEIKQNLGVDWSNVSWKDLRRPIISGLAASLFILKRNFKVVPDSLELQATIWSALRPGNAANSFYFDAVRFNTACSADRELDLVVVLDFAAPSIYDIVRVESFLETLLKKFHLALDSTRVGLVSRNQQKPIGSWFLNSQNSGLTILNVLKALRYTPGPVTTEMALMFARQTMFQRSNGGRPGVAKVVLLITDGITQTNNIRTETDTYQHDGINLLIVEVNKTAANALSSNVALLVQEPKCQNARRLKEFQELAGMSDDLASVICNAPILFPAGDYTYPCGASLVARLPDTTDTMTLQVSTPAGKVDIFGSNTYPNPDELSHDVHVTSTSGDSKTLFIRGSDPMFIRVQGEKSNTTCTGTFTVHVKVGNVPTDLSTCVIAGTVRQCNHTEMDAAAKDVILIPTSKFPFLCDVRNHTIEYFPDPLDPHKFIMCDPHEQVFVGLCPGNQQSCTQLTSGCKYTNPCPRTAILDKNVFYPDPCGKQEDYVRCSFFGTAQLSKCLHGQVWNLDTSRCVTKYVHDPLHNTDITTIDNPCVHTHADHVYFPYPGDKSRYIFCESHGNAYMLSCRSGVWNQETKACITVVPPKPVG